LPNQETPGNKDYVEWFEKQIGTPANEQVEHTAMGFSACQLLEIAIKKVGAIDREAIRDELYTMEVDTILGPNKVLPLESENSGLQTAMQALIVQWQKLEPGEKSRYGQNLVGDLKLEIVRPEEFQTADLIWPHPGWD